MDTTTCRVCRSVNHAESIRCLTCGSPMDLPAVPVGVDLDDLPAAPAPAPSHGWTAVVPPGPPSRRRWSGAATFFGVLAAVAFLCSLVMLASADPSAGIPTGVLSAMFALWVVSGFFWLWMLIDAISNSRVGWALAIFFLGVFGALGYALLGRSPRTASF